MIKFNGFVAFPQNSDMNKSQNKTALIWLDESETN